MLAIEELKKRWLIFNRNRNNLSIVEMMLLFSQKEISNQWEQYEKVGLLEECKIWHFPNPGNNAEACILTFEENWWTFSEIWCLVIFLWFLFVRSY